MRAAFIFAGVCLCLCSSAAELPSAFSTTRRSQQFIVHDLRPGGSASKPSVLAKPKTEPELITLSPDVLLISAERVREELEKELGLFRGAGKIHLFLRATVENDPGLAVVSIFFPDGWQYRVDLPDRVEELPLTRALVEVLLLEFANRRGGPKSAELPAWLIEGVSFNLLAAAGPRFILNSVPTGSMRRLVRDLEGADPVLNAREFFSSHSALTFSELNHPQPAQLVGENLKAYQHSAQLFVYELLRLPRAKARFRAMLNDLPYCWNWETAFLQNFEPTFQRILDVEKWWSVTALSVLGRDQRQAWSREICLQKLEEMLVVPAQVRLTTNTLPVRVQATLLEIIGEWEFDLQRAVLGQILNRLTALRYNAPPDVVPLIDGYRLCLQTYLQKRALANQSPATKREVPVFAGAVVQQTIKQLDDLLRQREALRRMNSGTVASSTNSSRQ